VLNIASPMKWLKDWPLLTGDERFAFDATAGW